VFSMTKRNSQLRDTRAVPISLLDAADANQVR
jgi:hypothetical protein